MPPSDAEAAAVPGQTLAVAAEALYLANLLLLPGLAFAALFWLWLRRRGSSPALARGHLEQTAVVSLRGGVLIVALCAALVALGGVDWEWTWVLVIIYFTCIHSTLVMFGIIGLSKALAGQAWRYPLIGPRPQ